MTDMETVVFFSIVALVTVLVLIYYEAKKRYFNPWTDKYDDRQPKTEERPEDFWDKIFREREEADLKFLDYRIEQSRLKRRFDKLKSPKPKWIQQ